MARGAKQQAKRAVKMMTQGINPALSFAPMASPKKAATAPAAPVNDLFAPHLLFSLTSQFEVNSGADTSTKSEKVRHQRSRLAEAEALRLYFHTFLNIVLSRRVCRSHSSRQQTRVNEEDFDVHARSFWYLSLGGGGARRAEITNERLRPNPWLWKAAQREIIMGFTAIASLLLEMNRAGIEVSLGAVCLTTWHII
jgi:hypothetical protein